jgi:glyoxylase-like metal-dependent hydrolase (beta-lactamase superfamily II)
MKLALLAAGYCTHSEHILFHGGAHRKVSFPAIFALIEHPNLGPILFDTGYTGRFYTETAHFPNSLYAQLTPVYVQPEQSAVRQLLLLGHHPNSVKHIIISHFHADHICGLHDFPNAQFHYLPAAYHAIRGRSGIGALRRAFLPNLLPADFEHRSAPPPALVRLPVEQLPFTEGYDLFGDGSIIGVELPGHARGQLGICLTEERGIHYFLCADACWHSRAYRECLLPAPITRFIFDDWNAYRLTFAMLCEYHARRPDVRIVPAHCSEFYSQRILGNTHSTLI